MRLRQFSAATVTEAMSQVRKALGEDAVIVSIEEARRGKPACVTAAIEAEAPTAPVAEVRRDTQVDPDLAPLLAYHGFPASLAQELVRLATGFDADGEEQLAQALQARLGFRPLAARPGRAIMLVGQPGQGKTLNCARLAAQAVAAGHAARIITLDGDAAGALPQLEAFCTPIDVPVVALSGPSDLAGLLGVIDNSLTLIDTPGINPYAIAEIAGLAELIKASGAEPVWVMAAGSDPLEAAECADLFHALGVRRFILSRADAARRFAAPIAAAAHAGLAFAGIAGSAFLADPLHPATPWTLARRLITKPDPSLLGQPKQTKAAS